MGQQDLELRAVELTTEIVTARVSAAAGRPNVVEGRECAGYFREILAVVRAGLGLEAATAA